MRVRLLFLLPSLAVVIARAQPSAMTFEQISLDRGLSQSTVNTIVQDGQGFLWFGTQDGLNRFDGYGIRVYRHTPGDSTSLSDNGIWSLWRDRDGDLWIGTMRGGLNRYSVHRDAFLHYRHTPGDTRGLSENNVTAVFQDSRGDIWAGTLGGGVNRLDPATGSVRQYRHRPDTPRSLSDNTVWAIREDRAGNLWLATWKGLCCYLRSEDSFVSWYHVPGNPRSLSSNTIRTLLVNDDGTIWVGTWGGGLDLFDPVTGTARHAIHTASDPQSISSNMILSLFRDARGSVWVGTGDAGLNRVLPDGSGFQHYRRDPASPRSLNNDIICSIAEDATGGLWIGTGAGGVNHFDWLRNRFPHVRDNPADPADLDGNDVWALLEDSRGDLWIGTYGNGLNHLDRKRGRYTHYRADPSNPRSLSHDNVIALAEGPDGSIWAGTEGGGLNRLDPSTGRCVRYTHRLHDARTITLNEVTALRFDREGVLWIGTNGGGLDRFDPATESFTHFAADTMGAGVAAGSILAITEDHAGDVWIGTWGGGVNCYRRSQGRFDRYTASSHGLSNNTILCIAEDSTRGIWLGTYGGGVNRLDPVTGTCTRFDERDGMPNNVVYAILPDAHGRLWLTTNRGLSRFTPSAGLFKNYDVEDGLQGNEFNQGSACAGRRGELFIGGLNGFNVFHPDSIRDNPVSPPVFLTSFRVFDRPVRLPQALSSTEEIALPAGQNFLSVEYVALNYSSPQKNRYAYRLEGLHDDWIDAGTRRYASYTNLDPGVYTLRIIASNNDGLWNRAGVAVRITLDPPFWRSWWFRLVAGAVALALLLAAYRLRVNKLLAIERLRTAIATDLHDDIGSTLTEIALYSDAGLRQALVAAGGGEQAATLFQEIGTLSRGLVDSMSDIVWAIDPRNDSFDFLLLRMKSHATNVLDAKGITHDIDIPAELSHLRLPLGFRRGFYLIFKEAINNVLRHARAQRVWLSVRRDRGALVMEVRDDGQGFHPGSQKGGNGLLNMRRRARDLHGTLEVLSAPSTGTRVTLRAPIP